MWWLAAGSGPGKELDLKPHDIAIRSIRHHDLTDKHLPHGELDDYWEFTFAEELDDEQVLEQPWTDDQQKFISQKEDCHILIGPPGSGKTSSLWRALELALLETRTLQTTKKGRRRALYITWSTRLAESAAQYFSVMAPDDVQVYDLTSLFSAVLNKDISRIGLKRSRLQFLDHVNQMTKKYNLKKKALSRPSRYYDLIRAWLIGRAPWSSERVGESKLDNEQERMIQDELVDVKSLFDALDLTQESLETLFPELSAAGQILELALGENALESGYEFVVIDEVQDITPLELAAAIKVSKHWSSKHPRLFIAGDEGQVVRPTFFEFSELNDLLFGQGYHPQSTTLASNLRCPKVIADSVIRAKQFNAALPAKYRPADQTTRASDYETEALLALSFFEDQREIRRLVETLSANPNVFFIDLYENRERLESDFGIFGELAQVFQTAEAVKGLEFASVCIVGASALIDTLDDYRAKSDPIAYRLDVNRLRVAMSRAVEHLIFIEPRERVRDQLRELIGGKAISSDWQRLESDFDEIDQTEGCVISLSLIEELLSAKDLSVDERVQGFITRAERLFFDESRADEAYDDLETAVKLGEKSGELSEELLESLNQLLSRIALTEAFRPAQERLLSDDQLMGLSLRDAVREVGGTPLLELMSIGKQWAQKEVSLAALRSFYEALIDPRVRAVSWLTLILSEQRYALISELTLIAQKAEKAPREIDEALRTLGFSDQEIPPLSLDFRRSAFDSLIKVSWQEAQEVWGVVNSEALEDIGRSASLHEAQGEWIEAAIKYEQLGFNDKAVKAYREAGEIERAIHLIEGKTLEELEGWELRGLELLTVTSSYLRRYPLTAAERAGLLRHGHDEVEQLCNALEEELITLKEQSIALEERSKRIRHERADLEASLEELEVARDELKAHESAIVRQEHKLRRLHPQSSIEGVGDRDSNLLSEREGEPSELVQVNEEQPSRQEGDHIGETMDALPAISNLTQTADLNQVHHAFHLLQKREDWLNTRASSLNLRELELRRTQGDLRLDQERLKAAKRALERRVEAHDLSRALLEEERRGLENHRQGHERRRTELNEEQDRLSADRLALSTKDQLLQDRERALILELETLKSETAKAQRAQERAETMIAKQKAFEDELTEREERLKKREKALQEEEDSLALREAKIEEYGQELSGFHPALITPRVRDEEENSEPLIASEAKPLKVSTLLEEDDWVPRYTSTEIKITEAALIEQKIVPYPSLAENRSETTDIDQSDTVLDLKPLGVQEIEDEALLLPAWFEHQGGQKLSAGSLVVDHIEGRALRMVYCPSGQFTMGSAHGEPSERPCHEVIISAPLLLAETLVTQSLWAMVMGYSPSRFVDPDRPVERVSWTEAIQFCNRLSALSGLKPAYMALNDLHAPSYDLDLSATGYRLPTEAEWEYCARAGEDKLFAGSERAIDVAWSNRSSKGGTQAVKKKSANAWGLFDMCGNVAEWCSDVATAYDHRPKLMTDPLFDSLSGDRVIRGGAWSCSAYLCRVSSRGSAPAYSRGPDIGLRVCRRA